jgi:hypothetical protein
MNVALYVLHYIHSTIGYGFTFTSEVRAPLHTYMSFPHPSDTEAYDGAILPKHGNHHRLTAYIDACWGSQIGNAVWEDIQLTHFKFRSMSGAIISAPVVQSLGRRIARIILLSAHTRLKF